MLLFPPHSLPLLKFHLLWHIHEETEAGWEHRGNYHHGLNVKGVFA